MYVYIYIHIYVNMVSFFSQYLHQLNNNKNNTDLFEKENRMYHRSVFIHNTFRIATEVLMMGKKVYLRIVKRRNNLKKKRRFGNTN